MAEPAAPVGSEAAKVSAKLRRGIMWTTVASAAANLIRIVLIAVLGRLLEADDFGLVAAGLAMLAFVTVFRDLGIGAAIVQHRSPGPEHIGTAFVVSTLIATALGIFMYLGAPWLGPLVSRDPEIVPLVRVLAALVFLRGLGGLSQQLCQRAMDFRTLAKVEVTSEAIGAVVSIACALAGFGFWSIVWGYLVESVWSTMLLLHRYPPGRIRFDREAFGELIGFGGGQTIQIIANIIAVQGDNAVVSRQLGSTALGFYSRAYELVQYPAKLFSSVVGSVLFPAFSRLQDDRPALRDAFVRTLFVNAVVLLPMSALLIVLAPETLHVLLGPGWDGAVLPFQIMLASMLFRTSYKVGGIVSRARGNVYYVAATQVIYAITVVGGALYAVRWGVEGVAITTTISILFQFVLLSGGAAIHVAMPLRDVFTCHLPAVFAMLATVLCAWPIANVLRTAGAPVSLTLICAGLAGAVGFFVVATISVRRRSAHWIWCYEQLATISRRFRAPGTRAPLEPPA